MRCAWKRPKFRTRQHFEEYSQVESVKQFIGVEAVVQNAVRSIAEGGRSEVRKRQVQQIKPDDVTFIAAHDGSTRGNQTRLPIHSDIPLHQPPGQELRKE